MKHPDDTAKATNVGEGHISFAINEGYVDYFCVALTSLLLSTPDYTLHIHIMTGGLSEKNQHRINHFEYRFPHCRIHYHDMSQDSMQSYTPHGGYISAETWYRLRLPRLLPHVDRVLYLDADLVVLKNLKELFDMDMQHYLCAGVEDLQLKRDNYKETIGLSHNHVYVNAGVLVMNLKAMREQNTSEAMIDYAQQHASILTYNDQDVVNIVCQNKIKELSSEWNFTTADARRNRHMIHLARIAHFTGTRKPWLSKCRNVFRHQWKKNLRHYQNICKSLKVGLLIQDDDIHTLVTKLPTTPQHIVFEILKISNQHLLKSETTKQGNISCISLPRFSWLAKCAVRSKAYDACILLSSSERARTLIPCDMPLLNTKDFSEEAIKEELRRQSSAV